MKLSILPLLLITSFTLYSQEIIEPGEDIMGAFNAPGTECYELFIEEAGEYLLSYNLMNVNIKVIYNGQELFSDYMAIFATDPKKAQIIFQNPGTYQICFSTTGTMAVYQCRIVKADNIVPGEAIPVKYGEYVLKEISADDSPVNYSFSGKADDKIRIGISGMFVANLKITSPSKTVLYDQSFAAPPPNGLKLDFELEENGDYLITVTPGWGFQQYSLSLYLLEPVQASFIKFNELYAGALANFGVNYLRFYACTGDTLQINYTGSTAYTTMQVITPGGETVICKDIIDENHIAHTLPVEEDGTYVVVISYDMQGILGYGLSVEMKPEFYKLSRFIIREMAHLYKKVYSFHASRNDILRIGLDLPSRILELKDPGGEIILRLDSTSSDNDKSLSFNEITLESTGIYLITIWHDFTGYSPVEMRFCASLVPEPSVIEIDNMYHISVPPYHRYPYSFNAEADHVIRIILPEASPMVTPAGDVITVNTGKTHMVQQSGNFTISAINSLTVTAETDILLKTIVPPENAVPLEIGKIFKDNIELYETPSIVYNGIAGDTVFVQAEIKELILSPNVGNIINTPSWLYVTRPSGGLLRIEGKPTGRISDNGYLITYSFKKNIILDQSGNHFMTLCMDKEVTENTVDVTMRIDRGGASIEVPFGTYSDYEVPGNYYCSVPQGLEKLFVILKRSNNIGYDQTWHGNVALKHGDQTWFNLFGDLEKYDDLIFEVNQPEPGQYLLPVFPEIFEDEIRGSVLFTGRLPEAKLNGWCTGVITHPYGNDWKMIEISQPVDTLYLETQGYGIWSKIYVAYDEISDLDKGWIFENPGEGYHIRGKVPDAKAGRYYIRYMDSAVLFGSDESSDKYGQDQSRVYLLYVGGAWSENSALLTLRDLSTHELGKGDASFTLFGSGLSSVNHVNLISETGKVIIPLNIREIASEGRELVAGYDFSEADPGNYRLEVSRPDTLVRYSKNIKISPRVNATIGGYLLTSDTYRVGREQKCIIRISNKGTVDIPFIAGYFYTDSELVRILVTDTPESEYDAGLMNEAFQDEVFTVMPFFIENLRVGDEVEFIYNIYSSSFPAGQTKKGDYKSIIPADETFKVGYKTIIISEADYYSLQEPMATAWYQFLISSESTPDSTKSYLEDLKLTGFIDLWNDKGDTNKKKESSSSGKKKARNANEKYISVLDHLPGKLPYIIPYHLAREGVKVVSEKGRECANSLDKLHNYLKELCTRDAYNEEEKNKRAVSSSTPEDKYGPAGFGMEFGNGYIGKLDLFEYRIDYWNKEDATAPAAIVYIRDTIDTNFNLKTLRFTEIGFLKWKMNLDGGQYFDINIDCRPEMPYVVNVKGSVDYRSREVFWVHTTLDPFTRELPDNPMAGYLPPIDSTGYQAGWVNFTIEPEARLPHGTSFENQAFVNFDGVGPWGPAPEYGPYTNIFDFIPPRSYVEQLEPVQTSLSFNINLNGDDTGSGIDHFDIYVSKDYGDAYLWKTTKDTTVTFTGENGSYYGFWSIATDRVGNTETMKSTPDTYTFIESSQTGIDQSETIDVISRIRIYPNPFRESAIIGYELSQPTHVKIEVYNLSGHKVRTMINENKSPGYNEFEFHAESLPDGMYFIHIMSGEYRSAGKLILLRP